MPKFVYILWGLFCNSAIFGIFTKKYSLVLHGRLDFWRVQLEVNVLNLKVIKAPIYKYFIFRCEPIDFSSSPHARRVLSVCHLYFLSKFTEFLDTIYFVLRKKNNQITVHDDMHKRVQETKKGTMSSGCKSKSIIRRCRHNSVMYQV